MINSIKELKVSIISFINSSSYPNWVRCYFIDAHNQVHHILEKMPVITTLDLDDKSEYPQDGYVRCRIIDVKNNIVTIDINYPFAIENENGQTIFDVNPEQFK